MPRLYQANKNSPLNNEVVNRNDKLMSDIHEVITPNRVASNVKLFSNNFNNSNNCSNNSSRSSSPRVVSSFLTSSAPKRSDSEDLSEEINNLKLITKAVSTTLTNSQNQTNTTKPAAVVNNISSLLPTDLELDEMSQETLTKLITRLESVANRLESIQVSQPSGGASTNGKHSTEVEEVHQSLVAYDDLVSGFLKPFMATSTEIGGDVKIIADLVEQAFQYERSFLLEASRCVKPVDMQAFYGLFSKKIEAVQEVREKNRRSEFFNHLSAISESIGALGWIAVSPAPSPYVKEMNDAAQFYTNRVLKDWREKDPKHGQWVKQWICLLTELQAYVKEYHTTGVTWNSTRKAATFNPNLSGSTNGTATKGAAPKAGGPPGPPPPPMPNFTELLADDTKKPEPKGANTDALFAAINQGTGITSGLKKVSDDQKTHKNPNLRQSAVVPGEVSVRNVNVKVGSAPVTKPPLFELDDKKWKIEYQNKRNDLVIDNCEIKQTVYIYKCKECTIQVKGKVNSILVDSCNRVGLVFEDLLSTIEFINCQSVQMQVMGQVPTVVIEKTDGCQVYLSSASLNTEVISSKSSAMNVLIPTADGEFKEQPIPESFKTVISPQNNKLSTCPTDI